MAAIAGVTVRTLHHDDRIGLLTPSERGLNGDRRSTAEDRWGDTLASAERRRRTSQDTRDDGRRLQAESQQTTDALVAFLQDGVPATDDRVMDLAQGHRDPITRWFHDGTTGVPLGLASMDADDLRFRIHCEDRAPGPAQDLHDAIVANAGRTP